MTHDEVIGEPISTSRTIFAIPPLNFPSHRVPAVAAGGYLHYLSGANEAVSKRFYMKKKALGGQWSMGKIAKWALNVGKK